LVSAQEQTAGVVRISDHTQAVSHTESGGFEQDGEPAIGTNCQDCQMCRNCQGGASPFLCKECYNVHNGGIFGFFNRGGHLDRGGLFSRGGDVDRGGFSEIGGLFCRRRAIRSHLDPVTGQMKYDDRSGMFGNNCRRKIPMSNAPFGMYKMAYPLTVNNTDPRDCHLYAAQGYGVNISVPLAPTVSAAYNYGWGVPSSRMTYISNPMPLPPVYEPLVPVQPAIPVQP
jgi:hypothetical protein